MTAKGRKNGEGRQSGSLHVYNKRGCFGGSAFRAAFNAAFS
jgi:hypothetical protein